jgi:protease I
MTQTTSPLRALLNVEASASVPKLSNAQMLDAPENSAIRDIWLMPPDNPDLHAGRKVAVVATDGVEEIELYPCPASTGSQNVLDSRLTLG